MAKPLLQPAPNPRHPTAPGIRVLCVDDHEVLVEGLRAQFGIKGEIEVAGWLPSADRVLGETARLLPDMVLLDIEMPGADAFEIADRLRHMFPRVRIVFLSAHVRDGYIAAAHRCGACGYFSKGDDLDAITAGIIQIARQARGAAFVMGPKVRLRCAPPIPGVSPDRTRARSRRRAPEGSPTTPLGALSEREIEVLRLIGKGLSRHEIARELTRSAKTIDGHQERILRKLALRSRAELMRFAIREGLAEA